MEEWKEYRLGDVISIAGGFAYKGNLIGKGQNYLLGMGCVSYNENFLDKGARQYEGDCPERYLAKPGDIVLATRQQSDNLPILGMPAIIPSKYEGCKMIVGANLYKVELKNTSFDNRYIYWLLKTPAYVNYIRSCQSGTTVRMITKSNIEDFVFHAPEKEERKKISDFIWTLDDKIEVNRRINENLEQQAQALFKSWFVDFEPFRDQPFIKSELGMIPEGWRVGTLGDIIEEKAKSTIQVKQARDVKGDYPFFTSGSAILEFNEPLVMGRNIYLNTGGVAGVKYFIGNAAYSTDTWCICGINNYSDYLYLYLKSIEYNLNSQYFEGSALKHLKKKTLKSRNLILPTTTIINDFNKVVIPMFDKINSIYFQNRVLSSLRDTLLPRLMSGELKVQETEESL